MIIEVSIKVQSVKRAKGLRSWYGYVWKEFCGLLKAERVDPGESHQAFKIADTIVGLSIGTDSTGSILRLRMMSVDAGSPMTTSNAQRYDAPPVPIVAFILASFRLIQGRPPKDQPDEDKVPIALRVVYTTEDKRNFDNPASKTVESMQFLRDIVPPAWYIPYAMKMSTPSEVTANQPA